MQHKVDETVIIFFSNSHRRKTDYEIRKQKCKWLNLPEYLKNTPINFKIKVRKFRNEKQYYNISPTKLLPKKE